MKIIAEITDIELFGAEGFSNAKPRKTARAILKNGDMYAIMYAEKFGLYSLPGGGIDEGEDPLTAMKREILEETGCTCGRITELGIIKESRAKADYTQISYYYVAEAEGFGEAHLEPNEIASGTHAEWHTLDEIVKLINDFKPSTYQQEFLHARDVAAINEYLRIIKNGSACI